MADTTKKRCGMPWCILYSSNFSQTEKLVFIALKDRAYQVDKTCVKGFYCYIDWLCANLQMSESTVKRAIKGLKEKKVLSSTRVKLHKNVVNLWSINWNLIDRGSKVFKFAEMKVEEVDLLDDEPTVEETTVSEVKTPSVPIKEVKGEEQDSTATEYVDTTENNEQITEDDMEKKDLTWLDSDEFYSMRVSKNIEYWNMLNHSEQTDKLNEEINKWVEYDSNRYFEGGYKDKIYNKIWSYINNRIAS